MKSAYVKRLFEKIELIEKKIIPTYEDRLSKLLWDFNKHQKSGEKVIFEMNFPSEIEMRLYIQGKDSNAGLIYTASIIMGVDQAHKEMYEALTSPEKGWEKFKLDYLVKMQLQD